MCLLVFAFKTHPYYRLILAANRDEDYDRPMEPASWRRSSPNVLSGRDLKRGGTWLGITKSGRIGAVTNYRDPRRLKTGSPSRGFLVTEFLLGGLDPESYLERLESKAFHYNGFNLLIGERDRLYWYSNLQSHYRELEPGIYGLSNSLLDTPWPKVVRGKQLFSRIISNTEKISQEKLFDVLSDRAVPEDRDLPDTGVGIEWERTLSPIFVRSPHYGTSRLYRLRS